MERGATLPCCIDPDGSSYTNGGQSKTGWQDSKALICQRRPTLFKLLYDTYHTSLCTTLVILHINNLLDSPGEHYRWTSGSFTCMGAWSRTPTKIALHHHRCGGVRSSSGYETKELRIREVPTEFLSEAKRVVDVRVVVVQTTLSTALSREKHVWLEVSWKKAQVPTSGASESSNSPTQLSSTHLATFGLPSQIF